MTACLHKTDICAVQDFQLLFSSLQQYRGGWHIRVAYAEINDIYAFFVISALALSIAETGKGVMN